MAGRRQPYPTRASSVRIRTLNRPDRSGKNNPARGLWACRAGSKYFGSGWERLVPLAGKPTVDRTLPLPTLPAGRLSRTPDELAAQRGFQPVAAHLDPHLGELFRGLLATIDCRSIDTRVSLENPCQVILFHPQVSGLGF